MQWITKYLKKVVEQYKFKPLSLQDSPSELAFKYAVYKINRDPHILANKTLSYDIQYVPREDSFRTTNKVTWSPQF